MSDLTAVSLFAGVGGFDEALRRAGVRVAAAVEIDAACRGVLARHFPETVLFDDVTGVTGDQLRAAGFVPGRGILAGGWPCQDLSIAGRRAGLGGARSGLFWEIVRLAGELSPRWLLLENVDDLLSSTCPCPGDGSCVGNGRAVRCGKLASGEWRDNVTHNPPGGVCAGGCMAVHGGAMGAVVGSLEQLGYGLCWRVLDAQYAGVPQRRSRLFLAGCLGDGATPVQVLLEPESSERDFEAGGQAGENAAGGAANGAGIAGVTGALTAGSLTEYDDNTARAGFMGDHETGAGWWTEGAGTLRAEGGGGTARGGHLVTASTLQGGGRRGHRVDAEGAAGGHLVPAAPLPSREVIACDTSREGKGADSDGTSGFIAVPLALRGRDDGCRLELGTEGSPSFALRGASGGGSSHAMIAHTLTSEGFDASEDGTGRGIPIVPTGMPPVASPLTSGSATGEGVNPPGRRMEDDTNLVAMAFNGQTGGKGMLGYGDKPTALQASQVTDIHQGMAVRRLSPLECERLQGFPDEWTRWLADGTEQSDSARYRQCGNAVAVPVVEWIAHRIVVVDAAMSARGDSA